MKSLLNHLWGQPFRVAGSINASAESFDARIKALRTQSSRIGSVSFFMYRFLEFRLSPLLFCSARFKRLVRVTNFRPLISYFYSSRINFCYCFGTSTPEFKPLQAQKNPALLIVKRDRSP